MGGSNWLLGGSVAIVRNGDVTIKRRIHPPGGNESFVTVAVRNATDTALRVRIEEGVSDAVEDATAIDTPEGDPGAWRFDGERICHECELGAADDRAIVYGVELSGGTLEMELSQPSIADVEPVAKSTGDGPIDAGANGDALWRGGTAAGDPATNGNGEVPRTASPSVESEAPVLVDRLVAELESADDGELSALREQLRPDESERIRLDHFRSRVDDLEAYVEVLETFIDEFGRPDDVVGDVQDRVDENERKLRARRAEIERLEEAAAERRRVFETTAEEFEDEFERLEREFAALRAQVEEWRDTQNQIAAALSGDVSRDDPDASATRTVLFGVGPSRNQPPPSPSVGETAFSLSGCLMRGTVSITR